MRAPHIKPPHVNVREPVRDVGDVGINIYKHKKVVVVQHTCYYYDEQDRLVGVSDNC